MTLGLGSSSLIFPLPSLPHLSLSLSLAHLSLSVFPSTSLISLSQSCSLCLALSLPLSLSGHCGSSKCLTTEGKLAWRIRTAWHSKSGTKNFAKFLSIPPSSPSSSRLSPSLSRSLISSLEISLRRLSSGKLVTSAGLRQQLFSPTLTTGGWSDQEESRTERE